MNISKPSQPPFELDPFALPQETRGRFRMFVAAAIMLTWSLGAWWVEVPSLFSINRQAEPELQAHFDRLKEDPDWRKIAPESLALFRKSRLFSQGMEYVRFQAARIAVSLCLLTLMGLLAWILYRCHPAYLARRYGTSPIAAPDVEEEVRQAAAIAGIEPPRTVLKPGFLDGLAFGLKGRETLALGGPLPLLKRPWGEHTRAVALHELAHIVNGDISTRIGSSSIWVALTAVLSAIGGLAVAASWILRGRVEIPVFRPSFSYLGAEESFMGSAWLLGRTLLLLLVVWWLWSELVRVREFYADARVATWGFRRPLLETLRLPTTKPRRHRLFRLHPSHESRARSLGNPQGLFLASPRLAFLTGLLLTLLGAQMSSFSTDLTSILTVISSGMVLLVGPFAVVLFPLGVLATLCLLAYLVTEALGTQVQREAIYDLALAPHQQWGYLRLLRTALFFALGLECGLRLSPFSPFSPGKTALWISVWVLALTFLVWLWLVFLKGTSRFFVGRSQESPRGARRIITLLSTLLLAALLGSALAFRLTIEAGFHFDRVSRLTPAGTNPVEFFVMMILMSSLFWLIGTLLLYLIVGLGASMTAFLHLHLKRTSCRRCGAPTPIFLLVGRSCSRCGRALAPWAFLGEQT